MVKYASKSIISPRAKISFTEESEELVIQSYENVGGGTRPYNHLLSKYFKFHRKQPTRPTTTTTKKRGSISLFVT